MCKSKFNSREEFKLLYRGSRDGFGADDFHSKCDNRPNTVTVIKTTKDYIFGGYTQIDWGSNEGYHVDTKAFLFSLVNIFKKPFICEVVNPNKAICCDSNYGPIFGFYPHAIWIFNNSNINKNLSKEFSIYRIPREIKDHNGIIFSDSQHFQVSEIEVFQIKEF